MKRIKKAIVVSMVTASCLFLCTAVAFVLVRVKAIDSDITLPIIISLSAAAALFFFPALVVTVVIKIRNCTESQNFVEERPGLRKLKASGESTTSDMIDIHIYDEVGGPTEPSKEAIYDYPTDEVSGEAEIAARRVEMTANPAYRTVTVDEQSPTEPQLMDTYDHLMRVTF